MSILSRITEAVWGKPEPSPTAQAVGKLQEAVETFEINRALEAVQMAQNFVDPFEPYFENGERWSPIGSGGGQLNDPSDISNFRDEQELAFARNYCRWLAHSNPFCINGIENRISYLVGTGHTYTAVGKKDERNVSPELLKAVQAEIDEFTYENRWRDRQEETVRRLDRDGECFRRFFMVNTEDGSRMRMRWVEPNQVCHPQGSTAEEDSFGIQTEPDDVETVTGYWIDGELNTDVDSIQHLKWNVDSTVKRGKPTYWPVRDLLRHSMTLLGNIAVTSTIQTAVAIIRRHKGGTKAGLEGKRETTADIVRTNQATGKRDYYERKKPGQIIDASTNTEYDFPASGINAGSYSIGLQAILRGVASRLVMPEYMLSSDASNGNYASSLVAEGPATKMFVRLQGQLIEDDLRVMWKVIRNGIKAGRIPAEAEELVEVQVGQPPVESRNITEEAQVQEALNRMGVMSLQTIAARQNLDWEQEQQNFREAGGKPQEKPDPLADAGDDGADELGLMQANQAARKKALESYLGWGAAS